MRIEVFGPGCAKCNTSAKVAEAWMSARALPGDVVKITALNEMTRRGIFRTPAVFIDGAKILEGRQLREKDLDQWWANHGSGAA